MNSSLYLNISSALPQKVCNTPSGMPIPLKRSSGQVQSTDLPTSVRDLVALLSQIAADEFMQTKAARNN